MIKATIIQDSISNGVRITTFELEYPRFIHSELMTHRVFSRNAASSRAIPIKTMNDNISTNPAKPLSWGKNKSGMQSVDEVDEVAKAKADYEWNYAKNDAIMHSDKLASLGIHKQWANRLTEPFQHMKTVVTSTEWENWYELRAHPDAQPEIQALATEMWKAHIESVPVDLIEGQWHLPYIHREWLEGKLTYSVDDTLYTLEEAKRLSVSCCAQVSYRKNDLSLEKADDIYHKLVTMKPFHASPFEHQATPMPTFYTVDIWPKGATHMDKADTLWSGNFRSWLQNRQLM